MSTYSCKLEFCKEKFAIDHKMFKYGVSKNLWPYNIELKMLDDKIWSRKKTLFPFCQMINIFTSISGRFLRVFSIFFMKLSQDAVPIFEFDAHSMFRHEYVE